VTRRTTVASVFGRQWSIIFQKSLSKSPQETAHLRDYNKEMKQYKILLQLR
jgi:hypothetical protein